MSEYNRRKAVVCDFKGKVAIRHMHKLHAGDIVTMTDGRRFKLGKLLLKDGAYRFRACAELPSTNEIGGDNST